MTSQTSVADLPDVAARRVVAAVLHHDGELCLLRRSSLVSSDRGLWHCVTGYLDRGMDAHEQACREVLEETGLGRAQLELRGRPGPLRLRGPDGGGWTVMPFLFRASTRRLALNWENDAVRWVRPSGPTNLPVVPWLSQVLAALEPIDESRPGQAATRGETC